MTSAIILAAGSSTRLGHPKQLVELGGETLLERSVRICAEAALSPVFLVLPPGRPDLIPTSTACTPVVNPAHAEGIAASIRAGISAAQAASSTGAVILACDQPAVTPAHLRRLASTPARVTASRYVGRHGVPAYFPASTFDQLLDLHGDYGARHLLCSADALDLPDGDLDIDTPAELTRARALFKAPGTS